MNTKIKYNYNCISNQINVSVLEYIYSYKCIYTCFIFPLINDDLS